MYSTPEYGALSLKNIIATLTTEGTMENCCHQFLEDFIYLTRHLSHNVLTDLVVICTFGFNYAKAVSRTGGK